MLNGKLVRVRHIHNRVVPLYLNPHDPNWLGVAEQLLFAFRDAPGRTRGELEAELADMANEGPGQLVRQGLAKLLEDRCEFEVASDAPPDRVREVVFRTAAAHHATAAGAGRRFDRDAVLSAAATELQILPEQVDLALFADLKNEQRVLKFNDCTPEQLLHRYNEALAQAVLLRSTGMEVRVWNQTPARFRQLFRTIKFRRLICTIRPAGGNGYTLHLDGPLSLFSSTQKYGLQLALFLPVLLHCKAFELRAAVRWGAQKKEKVFILSESDGLRSHTPDFGMYTPRELTNFEDNFRSSVTDWIISSDPQPIPVEGTTWVPDFTLTHAKTGKVVFVEIIGFWRKTNIEEHYKRLKRTLTGKFVLVVSEQYRADEAGEFTAGDGVYRFKRTPIAEEVAKVAAAVAGVAYTGRQ
jgi:predicted nuclease of restriction endonuclease-like RecB superfamily